MMITAHLAIMVQKQTELKSILTSEGYKNVHYTLKVKTLTLMTQCSLVRPAPSPFYT